LIFTFLMFWLIRVLPGDALWQETVGQNAFEAILGGISFGGIVLASVLAYLIGSFANSVIMAIMKKLTNGKHLWTRTIASTIVGEFLDSAIFIAIASLTGVFPWELFWSLTLTNYIFKGVDVYSDLSDLSPLSF